MMDMRFLENAILLIIRRNGWKLIGLFVGVQEKGELIIRNRSFLKKDFVRSEWIYISCGRMVKMMDSDKQLYLDEDMG